eukprot:3333656-Pleurochrysis_carterae.AAC.1
MDAEGAITCTTDASGIDGVGGYAFAADAPGRCGSCQSGGQRTWRRCCSAAQCQAQSGRWRRGRRGRRGRCR